MFYHELTSTTLAKSVIILAVATIILAAIYCRFAVRIVAGYHVRKHTGELRPDLKKVARIQRWARTKQAKDKKYTILFASTSTDYFFAAACTLVVVAELLRQHWYGIYQACMNFDGSYIADINGLIYAFILVGGFFLGWTKLLYMEMQLVQHLVAINLCSQVIGAHATPHFAQRRSFYFFLRYMFAQNEQIAAKPQTLKKKKQAYVGLSAEDRLVASQRNFFAAHPLHVEKSAKPVITVSSSRKARIS